MRKFVILAGALGSLALPAAAQASDTATVADRQNASQEANAFGKCVSKLAKTLKGDA
jgi:hypothetical protein